MHGSAQQVLVDRGGFAGTRAANRPAMPAIDSLLRLLDSQNADTLVVATDQAPRMIHAGASRTLSMPAIGEMLMDAFLAEVLDEAQRGELEATGLATVEYGAFDAKVKRQASGFSMSFKRRP